LETKPFYLTSEFWAMLLGLVVNALNMLGAWNFASNWHSGILATILIAFYNISRGQAKSGVAFDPVAHNNYKALKNRSR
jgi:hypothetical protein